MIGNLDPTSTAALITGGSTVVTAVLGYFAPKVHKGLKTAQEVKDQVSNGHQTNLRDDIDKILEGQAQLLAGQAEHTAQILDLQVDIAWERRERMDLARIVTGKTPTA